MTKHRHPVLTGTHLKRMERITYAVCTDYECELTEFNGENNPRPPPREPPAPDHPVQTGQQPQGRQLP
ncbi:transposase [Streptomyces sp. NBC_01617]|uniref:transposase n=1 Tax=unclassified Streptomyces TaxID=2593676 RepID=UPI003863D3ED